MTIRFASLGPLLLAALLCSSTAFADAVGPPPASCPEGSTPVAFCHGPQTCEIADCRADTDCIGGQVCRARPLCIREHCCSGRGCIDGGGVRYDHVEGACGPGGGCSAVGTTCETRRVCVTPDGTDAGTAPDAGSVDAGGSDGGAVVDAGDTLDSGTPGDDGGAAVDSGPVGMDAGGSDDAGPSGTDSGTGVDAGSTGTTDGGCCSVVGERSATGAALYLALFGLLFARRLRRRR